MSAITCKFGGTSLADAGAIRQALSIVASNADRRFVVPSAPGKRNADDKKITDLLYAWHRLAREGLDPSEPRGIIGGRFRELATSLGVTFDLESHLKEIDKHAGSDETPDYMASRGEYLNGCLIAEVMEATFVDPADYIKFDDEGHLDPVTYANLAGALQGEGRFVVPGFYGSTPEGAVKTFSRGGSDVTGAIVARATASRLYENWTDVSGFRMTDPRIVPEAKRIEEITYLELRELSYMGASVLHDEAIFPVREPGIPINIRNTNDPENPGTLIVPDRETTHPICGIAARCGFRMIILEKTLMNREMGFGRKVLQILEQHGVSFEHMPTGIDTMSVIVETEGIGKHGASIVKEIERICRPDRVVLTDGLALVATVGKGMNHHVGVAARLCTALADGGVNIRVIDQGSSETNIIVGVEEEDMAKAVRAIYDAFETCK